MMRPTQRLFLLAVLTLPMFSACHPRAASPDPVAEQAAPHWIRLKPIDADLVQGRGFAAQSADPAADRAAALSAARADLLTEIQEYLDDELEGQGPAAGMFPRVVWDDFREALEAIPALETYTDLNRHREWAYIVLQKTELEALVERRRESLEPRARRNLIAAKEAEARGDLAEALEEGLAGLARAAGPEGLTMPGLRPRILLRVEIESFLREVMAQLALSTQPVPKGQRISGLEPVPLTVVATGRKDGKPVRRLPVTLRFIKGTGAMAPGDSTDSSGRATVAAHAIDARVVQVEIEATVDLAALFERSHTAALPDSALAFLELPRAVFSLSLDPPRLLLSSTERGGSAGDRSTLVQNGLADMFREQGLVVQSADVDLLVSSDIFRKVEQGLDPGEVKGTDLVGVVVISLEHVRKEKGRYQEVLYGEGYALCRLFDLSRRRQVLDIRLPEEVTGFSEGDLERAFFLQASDELRGMVLDSLKDASLGERG